MRNGRWKQESVKADKQSESVTGQDRKTRILLCSSVKVNSPLSPQRAKLTTGSLCTCFSTWAWLSLSLCFDVLQRQKTQTKIKHRWLKPNGSNFWKECVESELSLLKSLDGHLLNVSAIAKPAGVGMWLFVCVCLTKRDKAKWRTPALFSVAATVAILCSSFWHGMWSHA